MPLKSKNTGCHPDSEKRELKFTGVDQDVLPSGTRGQIDGQASVADILLVCLGRERGDSANVF